MHEPNDSARTRPPRFLNAGRSSNRHCSKTSEVLSPRKRATHLSLRFVASITWDVGGSEGVPSPTDASPLQVPFASRVQFERLGVAHECLGVTHERLDVTHERLGVTHERLDVTHERPLVATCCSCGPSFRW